MSFAIQEYSDPENPGLIWQNTMDVLEKSYHPSWLLWECCVKTSSWLDKNSGRNSVLQKRAKNNKFKVPLKNQYIWA